VVIVHVNTEEVIAELRGRVDGYRQALEQGFAKAGNEVVELFRSEWLSGRTSGDLGLNIRTGRLYQSVRSLTEVTQDRIVSQVFNRGAPYWHYHQTGTDRLPKRLYLEEAFEEDGESLYSKALEDAIRRLVE
jgi:hypothetical protein